MNFDFSVDFYLTYCLLTVASFRIGVPSILFSLWTTAQNHCGLGLWSIILWNERLGRILPKSDQVERTFWCFWNVKILKADNNLVSKVVKKLKPSKKTLKVTFSKRSAWLLTCQTEFSHFNTLSLIRFHILQNVWIPWNNTPQPQPCHYTIYTRKVHNGHTFTTVSCKGFGGP